MKWIIVALTVIVALGLPAQAKSQVSFGGCYVGNGYPVPSVPAAIQDIASASRLSDGAPVIYYNPGVAQSFSRPTQIFFYYHECAHHVLGHVLGVGHPLVREQQADCWAIINLVRRGLFGQAEIRAVQSEIAAFGREDWTHLPGPQRAINLFACLNA